MCVIQGTNAHMLASFMTGVCVCVCRCADLPSSEVVTDSDQEDCLPVWHKWMASSSGNWR